MIRSIFGMPISYCFSRVVLHNDKDNQARGPLELSVDKPYTVAEANDVEKPEGKCTPVHRLVYAAFHFRFRVKLRAIALNSGRYSALTFAPTSP